MENTKLSLTRFSGGKEGMKVQLTMRAQDDFFTHITLNKKEIKKLIKELQENFDLG
jgi:predicted DNA-binding antitoxin AbrB/MazE fold protein